MVISADSGSTAPSSGASTGAPVWANDLALALRVADAADRVTLAAFDGRTFRVERKSDLSEVTEVDRGTETAISKLLQGERPHHSIYGEEHGVVGASNSPFQWVIDPIDGTSNFVRGVPVWATLIALVHDGDPVLGVVSAPALGKRWWATTGGGAHTTDAFGSTPGHARRLHVSDVADLARASASITVNDAWHRAGKTAQLDMLQRSVARLRNYGDFWQHMMVAEGALDFAIDAIGLGAYDIAALTTIVGEAGGRWTDRNGRPDWRANSLITTNGRLHGAVLDALGGDR
jgi:histidinol-phosphatase